MTALPWRTGLPKHRWGLERGTRVAFYRLIMALALPVLLAITAVQRWRGRALRGAFAERLGFVPRGAAGLWLHGASNGELTSARWLLEAVLAARPGLPVLVTANTGSARAMVAAWGLPGVVAALAPLDTAGAAARVLRRVRPAALLVVENELWPARLAAARAAAVPVLVIGGRISERSAAIWTRRAPGLMRAGLTGLRFLSAQDAGSAARFLALGLPPDRLGPQVMLKATGAATGATAAAAVALPQPVPRERVLLAASTHDGEEALVLDAFATARGQFDLLILAPRHPRRRAAVAAVIAARGLGFGCRSDGAVPMAGQPVFLADTMGEMALWYQMAGATVIGGSFADKGGHTPYEPAGFGSAILHGPSMGNFAEAAQTLALGRGAVQVGSGAALGPALAAMDRQAQARLAAAAQQVLAVGDQISGNQRGKEREAKLVAAVLVALTPPRR